MKLRRVDSVSSSVLSDRVVQRLTEAERALTHAVSIDQVRLVMDVAAAQEVFARRQQLGETVLGYAHAIKMHALARLGELLRDLPNAPVGRPSKIGSGSERISVPTLADLGIDRKTSMVAQQLADLPHETREAIAQRETTLAKAKQERLRAERIASLGRAREMQSEDWGDLRVCSMQALLTSVGGIDAIVSDPPYIKEAVPLYGELAKLAARALKPGGLVAVMCGQMYLPEIMALMTESLTYRWTLAYLMPGGKPVSVFPRHINAFWKPVLLFGGTDIIGDVIQNRANDRDKDFHEWGQNEAGMLKLVERLTKPGALVCDPFLGAGTTAVACKQLARRFVGCDVDESAVTTARLRLAAIELPTSKGVVDGSAA